MNGKYGFRASTSKPAGSQMPIATGIDKQSEMRALLYFREVQLNVLPHFLRLKIALNN